MVEGDGILRMAGLLRPRIVGHTVDRVEPATIGAIAGHHVEAVDAHGKHLLMRFDGGLVLHSHMGMDGSWRVLEPGHPWRLPARPQRARLDLAGGVVVACSGARLIRLTGDRAWAPPTAHLGPDVLAEPLDLERIIARSRGSEAAQLGDLLLDQRVCAGIGNMWRCEVLWELRLDPWTPAAQLDAPTVRACFALAHDLMFAGLRGARRPSAVHGRGRRPCPRCRGPIAVRAQGDQGRLTYWCPACQTRRAVEA